MSWFVESKHTHCSRFGNITNFLPPLLSFILSLIHLKTIMLISVLINCFKNFIVTFILHYVELCIVVMYTTPLLSILMIILFLVLDIYSS